MSVFPPRKIHLIYSVTVLVYPPHNQRQQGRFGPVLIISQAVALLQLPKQAAFLLQSTSPQAVHHLTTNTLRSTPPASSTVSASMQGGIRAWVGCPAQGANC